jgi:membrane protease subunit HflK
MNDSEHPTNLPTPVPEPEHAEDSGSQALSEALRSSFVIVKVLIWVLAIVFLGSGFFSVGPQEKAVILRFGRPVGEGQKALLGPGLHWSLPYPIDDIVRIPITEIQNVPSTIGWYYVTPEQELSRSEPPSGPSLNPAVDGYLITADANIVHSRVRLYYRIEDPIAYAFGFWDAGQTIRNALDNALLYTAAHFKVDDILYRDVAGFKDDVQRRVTQLLEEQKVGVVVDHCEVFGSIPPRQLSAAFNQVTMARENRTRVLNEAHTVANQILYQASARAAGITNEAATAKAQLVKSVTGDAKRFNDLLPNFRANPTLFMEVQWLASLNTAFTNVQDKIFLPERLDGKTRELRLLLNREPPKPAQTETP